VSYFNGKTLEPHQKSNPTQQDLHNCGDDPAWWIDVNETQWKSDSNNRGPPPTTLYYAVQEDLDHWFIHYIFLFAGQNGQTVRVEPVGTEFNTKMRNVGEHPGDLERVMVEINKGSRVPTRTQFEAHVDNEDYIDMNMCAFEEESHLVVHMGLNSHAPGT
jgi:hypothetical protein